MSKIVNPPIIDTSALVEVARAMPLPKRVKNMLVESASELEALRKQNRRLQWRCAILWAKLEPAVRLEISAIPTTLDENE